MKRLCSIFLVFLFLLNMSGCKSEYDKKKDELIALGYSETESDNILSLKEDNQVFFSEMYRPYATWLEDENFSEDNFQTYIDNEQFWWHLENDQFLKMFNDGYQNKFEPSWILWELVNNKYFMYENLDKYLEYYDSFKYVREENGLEDFYYKIDELIAFVNTKGYLKDFDATKSDTSKDILMIASKIYTIEDYVPDDLVEIPSEYTMQGNNYLRKEALDAYIKMADDARKEGQYFYVSTSYRSYDFQALLYNQYLLEDPQEVVDTYSSRPGYSDHQTGLTVDLRDYNKSFDDVKDTEPFLWLKDNSYKYGFIMRYPENKEFITRYEYEWWHFRYVGKEAAKIIHDDGITFDEYYEYYVNN